MRASIPNSSSRLIQHESNFRKFAVSPADARGYMQVMPFWVKQIGSPDQNLFHLRTNLRYGCTILRHYLDMENGDYYRALGRYNGSLGRPEYPNAVLANWKQNWSWTYPQPSVAVRAAQAPATTSGECNRPPIAAASPPPPPGPLHFGSLVAAIASWCDARAHRRRMVGAHRGRRHAAQACMARATPFSTR